MFFRILCIQSLLHAQRFSNDGRKLNLIINLLRRSIDDSTFAVCRIGVAELSVWSLNVGTGHNNGACAALITDREVKETWRWVGIVDDNTTCVYDVVQRAGEVWKVSGCS